MKYLSEEKERRLFLAGLLTEDFTVKEAQNIIKTADKESGVEKPRKNSPIKPSELEFTKDYSNTDEDDYLNFAQKAALIVRNKATYEKIITNVIGSLLVKATQDYNARSKTSILQISDSQIEERNREIAEDVKNRLDPTLRDSIDIDGLIRQLFANVDSNVGRLNVDAPTKINKLDKDASNLQQSIKNYSKVEGEEIFTNELRQQLDALRRNNAFTIGDEKATISYKFSADENETKLSPLGYWQIQFLSRVAANTPKGELEEILFSKFDYRGIAVQILRNFYDAAFQKGAAILMGRGYNENPNDHEFKIVKENALDKVFDGLLDGSYDTTQENFGAWAFTVAHNHIVNEIAAITDRFFNFSSEVLDNFISHDFDTLSFKRDPQKGIPEEFNARKASEDENKSTYIFGSPYDLFNYIDLEAKSNNANSPQLSPTWINNLTQESRNDLKALGAFKSVKKDADFKDEEAEQIFDGYAEKAHGEHKDQLFVALTNNVIDGSEITSLGYNNSESKAFAEAGHSKDDILEAFKRDFGKLLYLRLAEGVSNRPYWEAVPSKEFQEAFLKYASEHGIEKIAKKELGAIRSGDLISKPLFFEDQDTSGDLLKFTIDGVEYKFEDYAVFKETVIKGKNKKLGLDEKLKNSFILDQQAQKNKDGLTFVFDNPEDNSKIWDRADKMLTSLNIAEKDARSPGFLYTDEKKEEIENTFLAKYINNPPYHIPEIKEYITTKLNLDPNISVEELSRIFHEKRTYKVNNQDVNYGVNEKKFENDATYKALINKYENIEGQADSMYTKDKHINQMSNILSSISGFDVQLEESLLRELQQQLLEIKFFKQTLL